jgi:sortase A
MTDPTNDPTNPTNDSMSDPFEGLVASGLRSSVEGIEGAGVTLEGIEALARRRRIAARRRIGVAAAAVLVVATGSAVALAGRADPRSEVRTGDGPAPSAAPMPSTTAAGCDPGPIGPTTVLGRVSLDLGQVAILAEAGIAGDLVGDEPLPEPFVLSVEQVAALQAAGLAGGLDPSAPVQLDHEQLDALQVAGLADGRVDELEVHPGPEELTLEQYAALQASDLPLDGAQAWELGASDPDGVATYQSSGGVVTSVGPDGSAPMSGCPDGDQGTTAVADGDPVVTTALVPDLGASTSTTAIASTSTTAISSVPPVPGVLPGIGDPVGELVIPGIDLRATVRSGLTIEQLELGPGHDPASPLPGQAGNVVIVGHRSLHTQPFAALDQVRVGDQLTVETVQGRFAYEVSDVAVVDPTEVGVAEAFGDDRLTLIAPHPAGSAAQRLVVVARLVGAPAPPIVGQADARLRARVERRTLPDAEG